MMFYKNTTALSWAFLLIVFFSMGINCINAQNLDEIKIRTENSSLTIEQFFNYIEQNTPFKFSYNSESILLKKKIQLSNREESLYKILLWLGKLNEMTFQRIGNQIVVKKANKNETNFVADEISDDEKKEDNGFLRCLVTDSLSGEPLPFANVIIKELNRGGISNSKGYLIISGLRPQNVNVEISYIGFAKKNIQINIKRNVVTNLIAQLVSKNIQMGLIETKSVGIASESLTNLGLKTFSLKDIDRLPKGLELDVFKSLQNIAGVQSSGDASSRFFVRGSSSNENLILLDNTVLYNPFHAFGLLSAIDPDMINSVEFYKGGFPVDYTDRLSSVIRVNTKNGNNSNYSGKASLSLLTAKFLAEGPIPYGSFIITGRKNYSNWILEKYRNDDAMPADFYDLFAKIKYTNNNFLKDASFTLSTFVSNDKVVYQNPNLEDFKWNNKSIALNYFQVSDSPLFFQIDLSHSYFKGERLPN